MTDMIPSALIEKLRSAHSVAVLTGAGWMAVGLYRRHESLVTDLVRAGIIAIGVGLLPTVAGALGIGAGCSA